MVIFENDCVDCALPCINCGRKHSPHFYCDKCKEEFYGHELYDCDGDMYCESCLLESFDRIDEEDYI